MTADKGCAECTDWGDGNCTFGCFGPDRLPRHDPVRAHDDPFQTGTRVEVHKLGQWGYLVSLADEDDGYDEDEAHDARHPWWFPGCADCDERADRQEADR